MTPSERAREALEDIRDNILPARSFAAGMDLASFESDAKTLDAVIRCLEIISEASRRLTADMRARHPTLQWPRIAAAGNIYRHEYGGVRPQSVWITLQEALPPLLSAIEPEIARPA